MLVVYIYNTVRFIAIVYILSLIVLLDFLKKSTCNKIYLLCCTGLWVSETT